MRKLPPLRALLAFETTARHLSVGRAAEELCITSSAVSHQLKTLEEYLGVRLFHRTTRTIKLTDAGFSYFQLVFGGLDRIATATQDIVDAGFSDVLTVKCPPSLVPGWLMSRLGSFHSSNPDIDLRIQAPSEPLNRLPTMVDMELRYGFGETMELVVEPFLEEAIVPLANPEMARHLLEKTPFEVLTSIPLIHSERSPLTWTAWLRANRITGINLARGLRFDRGYFSIQAAAAGHGIALESTVFADHDLRKGNLVRLFEDLPSPKKWAHFMAIPPANAQLPKVQKFKAWLLQEAAKSEFPNPEHTTAKRKRRSAKS